MKHQQAIALLILRIRNSNQIWQGAFVEKSCFFMDMLLIIIKEITPTP